MGVTDQHKTFCKVTVHRSEPRTQHKPWQNARSTIAYKQLTPPPPTKDELARWTATGAAAIDGMPSRRRAATTTTAMEAMANFSTRDPLSRMTMRYEQDQTSTTPSPTMDVSELDTANDRSDSFLFVDTDHADPVRQTFDEDTKMFVPATPPIPSGISIDMLPTVDFTPKLAPSHFTTTANDLEKAFAIPEPEYEDNDWKAESRIRFSTPQSTPRESRIRISTPGQENALSSLFGSHADYVDELPTPLLSSSMGTPLDDHKPLSAGASVSEPEPEPIAAPESFVDEPAMAASYEEIPLSTTPQPMVESEVVDEDEEEDDVQQAFVEVDSEGEDDVEMDDNEDFDVCENFDAILGEPLPNRGSRWRFSINPKKSLSSSGINLNASRQKRGMSSPPRMVGMPPQPNLARHMSVPAAFTPPHNARPKPIVHAPVGEPLYHGQMLHLQFKSSAGNTVQVSAHQRRSKSSVFSKLIECFSVDSEPFADGEDALRIIAHTTDGHIRGGDRISLARGDGSVLRIQKMSKKLGFSPKIDMKAKFVVCGVPEGTVVTDTNKFYLQSVYDRTKTVGFLKDRRHPGAGCLVMYAYRTTDDKSEPIQFFKRPTPPSFAAMHTAQQGHNLPLSPVSGALM